MTTNPGEEAKVEYEVLELVNRPPLRLCIDWSVGIGGGLWTTGKQVCQHLGLQESTYAPLLRGKRVLELGSGTGLAGLAASRYGPPAEVFITDLPSHIGIIQRNIEENAQDTPEGCSVIASAYDWGQDHAPLVEKGPFDLILGADLAYYSSLHKPLVKALGDLSSLSTLILLGITRLDTGIDFFDLLEEAGFEYYKVPDTACATEHRGSEFGLFLIRRRAAPL